MIESKKDAFRAKTNSPKVLANLAVPHCGDWRLYDASPYASSQTLITLERALTIDGKIPALTISGLDRTRVIPPDA